MLVLSWASYRFVEQPFHRGRFLDAASKIRNARSFELRDLLVGTAVLALIAAMSIAQVRGPAVVRSAFSVANFIGVPAIEPSPQTQARDGELASALDAEAWPNPVAFDLNALFATQQAEAMGSAAPGCRNDVFQTTPTLVCGEGERFDLVVLGDSVALSWMPAITTAAESTGLSVGAMGFASCPFAEAAIIDGPNTPGFQDRCNARQDEMAEWVDGTGASTVILSSAESSVERIADHGDAGALWQEAMTGALERLDNVKSVIVLGNPPSGADPAECATRATGPAACESAISKQHEVKAAAERAASRAFSNTRYVEVDDWFCVESVCPMFIGTTIVRTDATHLTSAASAELADVVRLRVLGPALNELRTPPG